MANYIIDRIKPKYCTWPDILYEKIMNLENASESLILPKSREEVINYLKFWNRTSLNNNSSIDVIQYEELIYYEIEYFNDEVVISNHAVNGRSTKSFIDEGRWQKVLDELQPGDYVIIQFGHNDEKKNDPKRYTEVGGSFDDNLRRYVNEAKAKGANPILLNCVARRNFSAPTGKVIDDEGLRDKAFEGGDDLKGGGDTLIDTHGAYKEVPRAIAKELGVPFVDANKVTSDLEQGLGAEGSKKLHMIYSPGECPAYPKGRQDNTHYNQIGARIVAGLLAIEIGNQVPALRRHLK